MENYIKEETLKMEQITNIIISNVQETFIYRIGNFTILESDKNRSIANKIFEDKLDTYHSSRYHLSENFGYNKWNQENIANRQKYLAKQAKSIWSLSY